MLSQALTRRDTLLSDYMKQAPSIVNGRNCQTHDVSKLMFTKVFEEAGSNRLRQISTLYGI